MIQAQSADGAMHEFPDGTDPAVVDRTMKDYAQKDAPPAAPQQGDATAPRLSGKMGEFAEGLTEPRGLAADLARFGAEKAGVAKPLPPASGARAAGRFASGVGADLAALALVPEVEVPAAMKWLWTAAKAAGYGGASEAAGEAQEHGNATDIKIGDVARGMGEGLFAHGVLSSAGKLASTIKKPISDTYGKAVDYLKSIGAKLSPAQESGRPALKAVEGVTDAMLPAGPAIAHHGAVKVQESINSEINRLTGQSGKKFTVEGMNKAFDKAGNDINKATAGRSFKLSPQESQDINGLLNAASPQGIPLFKPRIMEILNDVANTGRISGEHYQTLRQELGMLSRDRNNGAMRHTFGESINVLDDAVERNLKANGHDAEWLKLVDARRRYRGLLSVQDLYEHGHAKAGDYDISKLMPTLVKQNTNVSRAAGSAREHPLMDMAHAGQELQIVPQAAKNDAANATERVIGSAARVGKFLAPNVAAGAVASTHPVVAGLALASPLAYRAALSADKIPASLYSLITKGVPQIDVQSAPNAQQP